jgi:alpha-galactosidase
MYRSTGDIVDTYESFANIMVSQIPFMNANAAGCFNDLDMLTVGMHGKGFVGRENCTKPEEYITQFVFWCLTAAPLMMGADIRDLDEESRKLLQNKELIRLNQDSECRPAYQANGTTKDYPIFIRMLENGEFALVFFNLKDAARTLEIPFSDIGVPYSSGVGVSLYDMLTGEDMGIRRDDMRINVPAHGCRAFRAKLVRV